MKRQAKRKIGKRVSRSVRRIGRDFKDSPLARAARGERVRL